MKCPFKVGKMVVWKRPRSKDETSRSIRNDMGDGPFEIAEVCIFETDCTCHAEYPGWVSVVGEHASNCGIFRKHRSKRRVVRSIAVWRTSKEHPTLGKFRGHFHHSWFRPVGFKGTLPDRQLIVT